jgi:hypothetical protein
MKNLAFSLGVALIATSASAQPRPSLPPQGSIFVLVDLSTTWLNASSAKLNERILNQVASAIASTAAQIDPPVTVRYISIGDRSLNNLPLCELTLHPKLVGKPEPGVVSTIPALNKFLTESCARFVLSRRGEVFTDISGALDTVSRANASLPRSSHRAILILSDLKEERRAGQNGRIGGLENTKVALLYRTLPEDRDNSSALDARIKMWTSRLSSLGARPKAINDVYAAPGTIAEAISNGR